MQMFRPEERGRPISIYAIGPMVRYINDVNVLVY
jgi:hypothetical protein